jgi:hypothetical protein
MWSFLKKCKNEVKNCLLQPLEEFDQKQEQNDQDEHDKVHPSEGDVPPEFPPVVLIFLFVKQIKILVVLVLLFVFLHAVPLSRNRR